VAQFFTLKNNRFKFSVVLCFVIVMANLNAAVDHFSHPEIPYFDKEHLLVGGITGFVGIIGFGLVLLYAHSLESALRRIKIIRTLVAHVHHV